MRDYSKPFGGKTREEQHAENIEKLKVTRRICSEGKYETDGRTVRITEVPENTYIPRWKLAEVPYNTEMEITVLDGDSFGCVIEHQTEFDGKRALVLNFANPFVPGGGVRKGSAAQEEDLCRRSNLLNALEDESASSYYEDNYDERGFSSGFERCILTENVTVFVDSDGKMLSEPVVVDVLTAAAPKLDSNVPYLPGIENDEQPVYGTIDNICEMILSVAEKYGYKILILGAFGCGAFKNDPHDVAEAFKKSLTTKSFEKVYFPILRWSERGQRNFDVFKEVLEGNEG